MKTSYNLTDRPWIGVVDMEGRAQELSLRQMLNQAHELRSLHDDSPLVVAAMLRMLIALVHGIYAGPRDRHEWAAIWQAGQFDAARIDDYFERWHLRFDLFDEEFPFYQVNQSRIDDQPKSISALLFDLSTGNNATLFDHTTDDISISLSPDAAARTIVTAQAFGLAGPCNPKLKLYFTDGTAARGINFFAAGNTLFETLSLNLLQYPQAGILPTIKNDCPAWEADNPFIPQRPIPNGYLDYLTWQSRRIRLLPEVFGDSIAVRQIYLSPGLRLDETMGSVDPMKHYRIDADRGHISLRFQENRAVWRDSAALLQLQAQDRQVPATFRWLGELTEGARPVLDATRTFRILALGMASNQAKVEFFRSEQLPLPLAYLDDPDLVDSLTQLLLAAEAVASELWKATGTMAQWILVPEDDSERKANKDDVKSMRATMAAERRYWSQLEPQFRQAIQAIPHDQDAAQIAWLTWLRRYAYDVFEQVANGLGENPRALKAIVRGRAQLTSGLRKILKIES